MGVITALDGEDRATVLWLTTPPCIRVIADVCLVSASSASDPRQLGEPERKL